MRDEKTARGVAQHRRKEKGAGIERDRRWQLFPRYYLCDDGIQRRPCKSPDHTRDKDDRIGQPLQPVRAQTVYNGADRQRYKARHTNQITAGGGQQEPPFVTLVDDMSGIKGQAKGRKEFAETDEADGESIVRDLINAPSYDGRHHAQGHDIKKSGDDKTPVFRYP